MKYERWLAQQNTKRGRDDRGGDEGTNGQSAKSSSAQRRSTGEVRIYEEGRSHLFGGLCISECVERMSE